MKEQITSLMSKSENTSQNVDKLLEETRKDFMTKYYSLE